MIHCISKQIIHIDVCNFIELHHCVYKAVISNYLSYWLFHLFFWNLLSAVYLFKQIYLPFFVEVHYVWGHPLNMVNLLKVTVLKKIDNPSPSTYKLSIASQPGVGFLQVIITELENTPPGALGERISQGVFNSFLIWISGCKSPSLRESPYLTPRTCARQVIRLCLRTYNQLNRHSIKLTPSDTSLDSLQRGSTGQCVEN